MPHSHAHDHATGNITAAFFLNTTFAVIELTGGFLTNSVAILSDAIHDLGDSLSLGTAWYFQRKSKKAGNEKYTYGYRRFSLAGAFMNALVLTTGSILIIKESIARFYAPEPANYKGMVLLAILGVLVNGAAMWRLKKGTSINEKVVSLHFLEDVLGWILVLAGAVIMHFTGLFIIDPVLSLLIAIYILFNVYRNIRPAFRIVLQGVPGGVDENELKALVLAHDQITDVHDFRIWSLDGEEHVASMHVVVSLNLNLKQAEQLKEKLKTELKALHIHHCTIEVEFEPDHGSMSDLNSP